jgi:NTP pyrophosphatase (non-canonical NTP hydrolase)
MINELCKEIHENAKSKGFFDSEKNIGEMLMLIVTEVAEACEADRKSHYTNWDNFNKEFKAQEKSGHKDAWKIAFDTHIKDTFEDELADIMIRVMDLAAFKGIDLQSHIEGKMNRNKLREYKHGKKY